MFCCGSSGESYQDLYCNDVAIIYAKALCIRNDLLEDKYSHEKIPSDAIKRIFAILQFDLFPSSHHQLSARLALEFCWIIGHLSNKDKLLKCGLVNVLVSLLSHEEQSVRNQTAWTIRKLTHTSGVVNNFFVPTLANIRILINNTDIVDIASLREFTGLLCYLCTNPTDFFVYNDNGLLEILWSLMAEVEDHESLKNTVDSLTYMALSFPEHLPTILPSSYYPVLVRVTKHSVDCKYFNSPMIPIHKSLEPLAGCDIVVSCMQIVNALFTLDNNAYDYFFAELLPAPLRIGIFSESNECLITLLWSYYSCYYRCMNGGVYTYDLQLFTDIYEFWSVVLQYNEQGELLVNNFLEDIYDPNFRIYTDHMFKVFIDWQYNFVARKDFDSSTIQHHANIHGKFEYFELIKDHDYLRNEVRCTAGDILKELKHK